MGKVFCIYHGEDFDGMVSAAIFNEAFNRFGSEDQKLYFIPFNYGDKLDFDNLKGSDFIIMCDISLSTRDDMLRLKHCAIDPENFIWIDHHETAIKIIGSDFNGIRDTKRSGCYLTWEYFFPNTKMPTVVEYAARYDIWDHNYTVLAFQYGLRYYINVLKDPESELWYKLGIGNSNKNEIESLLIDFINIGKIAYEFDKTETINSIKKNSFKILFAGYTALVVNSSEKPFSIGSEALEDPDIDIYISFHMIPSGEWVYGIRTNRKDINCGQIAKEFGGGGHPGAAGFKTEKLIKEIIL